VTRNCDNIFQKEKNSLFEKVQSNSQQSEFKKEDVLNYITNFIDDYYIKANIDITDLNHPVALFEGRFRETVCEEKDKQNVKAIVETHIKESKNIDPFLHDIMMEHYKEKKNKNKENEEKKIEKLLANLEKAKGDIEHHEILHQLSDKQEQTNANKRKIITKEWDVKF